MKQPATCTVVDTHCAARHGVKYRGTVVACFLCQQAVCLSCSIRAEVPAVAHGTAMKAVNASYGQRMVCHACAHRSLHNGSTMVRIHNQRLAGRGEAKEAPQTRLDAVSSLLTPPSVTRRRAKKQQKQQQRERAPAGCDDRTLWNGWQAPAVPAEYPEARRRTLGYAR